MDKRRTYYLIVDTETANGLDDSLVYDFGYAVIDKNGTVYESGSYVLYDIFVLEKELMQSAYYAEKIPQYEIDLANGSRKMVTFATAMNEVRKVMREYNITKVVAHNARFDYRALNTTLRYITKSEKRYFFPYGTEIWCTMLMAGSTICKQKLYKEFCEKNGYITKNGQVRKTAEILYRYLNCENDFIESHTALEDVMIEKEIFARALATHKAMRKRLF